MFSLGEGLRFYYYDDPTDMRKSYDSLSGIVRNKLCRDPNNGDVYIFMNRPRTHVKLLHWESGGQVIYSKRLERGTFGRPRREHGASMTGFIEWPELVMIVSGMIEDPRGRRKRMATPRKC